MADAAEKCSTTCQAAIDVSTSSLNTIEEFAKSEKSRLHAQMECGPVYRDIANIVEAEANVTRQISKLHSVSQHFDMRGEKKLQSRLSDPIKAVEIELHKVWQCNTIHASQISQIEAALDCQSAAFECEFEVSNNHIKKLLEEKNDLYAKEMTLRKNIQRLTTTLNARSKRAMAKGGS